MLSIAQAGQQFYYLNWTPTTSKPVINGYGYKTYETIPQDISPPASDPMWILPDTRGIKKRPADYAIYPEHVHINPLRSTYVFQRDVPTGTRGLSPAPLRYREPARDESAGRRRSPSARAIYARDALLLEQAMPVLAHADEDRTIKRINQIAFMKSRDKFLTESKAVEGRPKTSDPRGRSISKRAWERQVEQWRYGSLISSQGPDADLPARQKRHTLYDRIHMLPRCDIEKVPPAAEIHLDPFFKANVDPAMGLVQGACLPFAWCPIVGIDAVKARLDSAPHPNALGRRCMDDWGRLAGWQIGEEHSGGPPKNVSGRWFTLMARNGRPHVMCSLRHTENAFTWSKVGVLVTSNSVMHGISQSASDAAGIYSFPITRSIIDSAPLGHFCGADEAATTPVPDDEEELHAEKDLGAEGDPGAEEDPLNLTQALESQLEKGSPSASPEGRAAVAAALDVSDLDTADPDIPPAPLYQDGQEENLPPTSQPVSYTHLTLPTNREV